ncbi:SLFN9 protein, partial [Rhinopomastus cyanomelas]|nr:SLFN9 protein [Rhinopomastus cyanomelas]
YPEVVLCMGRICLGEKARQRIPKNAKQDQKLTLARALCALLNSGGGVVRAEIDNENYSLENIGLDLEETFRSLLFSDWRKYLDFEQRNNDLLIFVKTWSSESAPSTSSSAKPRVCSLSTGLYTKSGATLSRVTPTEAILFFKEKQDEARRELSPGLPAKKMKTKAVEGDTGIKNKTVAESFKRDHLQRGEILPFSESVHVEFKDFSTEKICTRVSEILPRFVAAFANADGGCLWIGVDDNSTVKGFSTTDGELQQLSHLIDSVQDKLTLFHFCGRENEHSITHEHKLFKVYDKAGEHCGYVCAVKIQPFTCIAFSEDPDSWLVENSEDVRRLGAHEWAKRMTDADPDLSTLSEMLRLELSLTNGPPLSKPVYSHQGLDNVDDLCKQLFPVDSHSIIYTPEKLSKDLLQEHPGLDILMKNQLNQHSEGVLMFSRSWAVEVGLAENQNIICDALLIAEGRPPTLYTVCEHLISEELFHYSRCVALRLKEKLVNTGGYIQKLCVIPKLLTLSAPINCANGNDLDIQAMYPQGYSVVHCGNMKALLRAITVALLSFKSFFSEQVGYEFLNLLTYKQYQLLSENLHKTKKLYVYGLPGTGKTIVALNIIKKIKAMLQCSDEEVLYVCENQPLRDFVRQKKLCQAVTRVAFLNSSFDKVKHIIIDEAQNFRLENGDWYEKAWELTSSRHLPKPGFFWIFLDYLQTSHCFETGLPAAEQHDPVESLSTMVRNADNIYNYLKTHMETIVRHSPLNIPSKRLEGLVRRATCAHTVPGRVEEKYLNKNGIVKYVAEQCREYLRKGYSAKDIAVLCYTDDDAKTYRTGLEQELKKSGIFLRKMEQGLEEHNSVTLDSIRRFSGLERSIVFGIIPQFYPSHNRISKNILVCVASRANLNLHLL